MIDNTINDDKAIVGGGEGAILAGRYPAYVDWANMQYNIYRK